MISWNYAFGWVAVLMALAAYFYFIVSCGGSDFKRKWFPVVSLAVNVLTLGVAFLTLSCLGIVYSLISFPVLAFIGYFVYKTTKFCDSCGSAAPAYVSFRNVRCCPRCKKQFAIS